MINLSEDGFAFAEMLRSAKEVKDREYRNIFLQAGEKDYITATEKSETN